MARWSSDPLAKIEFLQQTSLETSAYLKARLLKRILVLKIIEQPDQQFLRAYVSIFLYRFVAKRQMKVNLSSLKGRFCSSSVSVIIMSYHQKVGELYFK